jgi:hypothetical protein
VKLASTLLIAALAVTLAAAYWAPSADADSVVPVTRPSKANSVSTPTSSTKQDTARRDQGAQVAELRTRANDEIVTGTFQVPRTPVVPRARPATPASAPMTEPTAPQAPPLVFKVLGRYIDTDGEAVFLQHNDQNLVARAGETLLDQYKVEKIAGSSMTLLFLPLNQKQVLELGAAP